jgi:hypothetical protein
MTDFHKKIFYISLFAVAMAYFESAVVVYLRELYYPEGFSLPLKDIDTRMIRIELFRELATLIMLITVSAICGKKFWERFGYFIILFGIWDIFYYLFLKITLGWPSSLFEWDVLFLIPYPWIGPVIAPSLVALLMVIIGISITNLFNKGCNFKPTLITWLLAIIATGMILYSFVYDTDATLRLESPHPYLYWLLISGLTLYIVAYLLSYKKANSN